ncbi:DUF1643 domain-containing protein [Mycolicibacterium neoaurum]|uniref:DUF1643 domain-containing protein n=1 Tax=Mycolicibacterium neoaurum TaxID=1795 RepID=UPI001F4CF7ED|nr:DUF1643 domain-containing protein [Mycolicibacterium neoaurum]
MTLTLDLQLPLWTHVEGDAQFSPDCAYRCWLTRRWGPGPALMFVSLNPSDADEYHDDQTTRRDMHFARGFGYDAVTLINFNAAVLTNPKHLRGVLDPIGPDNDLHLARGAARHDVIVVAWGSHADPARARAVAAQLWRICLRTGAAVAHLGWTAGGQPRRPSRLANATQLSTLTASAHLDFSDVDPRWVRLLSDPECEDDVTDADRWSR